MTTIAPVNDIQLSFTQQGSGSIVVDFVATAQNDFGQVAGPARLIQDVNRLFFEQVGANPFRPTEGNPLFNQVGRPQSADMVSLITGIIEQIEAYMLTQQQQAAALGYRSLNDMLASFQNIVVHAIAPAGSGAYNVSLTVVSRSGEAINYVSPVFSF